MSSGRSPSRSRDCCASARPAGTLQYPQSGWPHPCRPHAPDSNDCRARLVRRGDRGPDDRLRGDPGIAMTRPYLWPAGAGAVLSLRSRGGASRFRRGHPTSRRERGRSVAVTTVAEGSPAALAGVARGNGRDVRCAPATIPRSSWTRLPAARNCWRHGGRLYWDGVQRTGHLEAAIGRPARRRDQILSRPAVWESNTHRLVAACTSA